MSRKPQPIYYIIKREAIEELGLYGVLDMLRYDGATVECNPPDGYYLFCNELGPHIDRWRSFGISIPANHVSCEPYGFRDLASTAPRKEGAA